MTENYISLIFYAMGYHILSLVLKWRSELPYDLALYIFELAYTLDTVVYENSDTKGKESSHDLTNFLFERADWLCVVYSHILRKREGSVNENILAGLKASLLVCLYFQGTGAGREVDSLSGYFNI